MKLGSHFVVGQPIPGGSFPLSPTRRRREGDAVTMRLWSAIHSQEPRGKHHQCCHDLGGASQAAMTREAGDPRPVRPGGDPGLCKATCGLLAKDTADYSALAAH